jgi:hypothetical protein
MGSFLDLNVNDAVECKTAPAAEYQLRIMKAEVKQQKPEKGTGKFIQLKCQILDENPYLKDVSHVLMLPGADDDLKQQNNRKLRIKEMVQAIGNDPAAPIDVDSWEGATFWAILKETHDDQFGDKNEIQRVVVRR